VSGRPVTPLERYVDAGELAAIAGVSTSTIKRWVRAGCPSETWGMARTRRFLPSQALAWASARGRMGGRPGPRSQRAPGSQPKE
jgi:hypothetical protein